MKYETFRAICSLSFQYWVCRRYDSTVCMEKPPLAANGLVLLPSDPGEQRLRFAELRQALGKRVRMHIMDVLRYEDGSVRLRSGGVLVPPRRLVPETGQAGSVLDLDLYQLRELVGQLQSFLYVSQNGTQWDPDREVNGGDLVEFVTDLMRRYGLEPEAPVAPDQDTSQALGVYYPQYGEG